MQNGRSVLSMVEDWILVGSEGEGEEGGASGSNQPNSGPSNQGSDGGSGSSPGGDDGGNGEGTPEAGGGSQGDGGDEDKFDRAYVEQLRKEAADYRTRARKAEEELDEKKKAEMSELEKAQTEAQQHEARAQSLEDELDRMRLQIAVTSEATSQNFYDPQDALSLIDRDSISKNDDGIYNKQSVEAAVKRLATAKPHLIKGRNAGAGSGDGGARGQGGGNMTEEERQKQLQQEYAERGGVPIPKL